MATWGEDTQKNQQHMLTIVDACVYVNNQKNQNPINPSSKRQNRKHNPQQPHQPTRNHGLSITARTSRPRCLGRTRSLGRRTRRFRGSRRPTPQPRLTSRNTQQRRKDLRTLMRHTTRTSRHPRRPSQLRDRAQTLRRLMVRLRRAGGIGVDTGEILVIA